MKKFDNGKFELRSIKRGGLFLLSPDGPTYARGYYDASTKDFMVLLIEQYKHFHFQPDALVYPKKGGLA